MDVPEPPFRLLSRRQVLRGGVGAAALAAVGGDLLVRPRRTLGAVPAPPAGAPPRRMVVLGPAGTMYAGSPQDYRTADNRRFFSETHTGWVRLWADWPTVMPTKGTTSSSALASLDAQISQARADGLKVILTTYRFPGWANGTAALTAAQLAATMPDRRRATQDDSAAKSLLMRYPSSVSSTSDWGKWIGLLVARYSRGNSSRPNKSAYVDCLEIANEPNHTWWPQQSASATADPYAKGSPTIHKVLAQMFKTAKGFTSSYGGEPFLMGPGTSDDLSDGRLTTSYSTLTSSLLAELRRIGFSPGAKFIWSVHNYADVTYDQGPGSTAPDAATRSSRQTNNVAATRALLVGGWAGWPSGSAADPYLFITEGGVTLASIQSRWGITDPAAQRAKQAELIQRNWARMTSADQGAGVGMVSNYLFGSDPSFDCGLCDVPGTGGPRPAYAAWGALPAFA
jgi:hypothetical protein